MRRNAGLKALLTIPAVVLVAVTLVALPAFGQTTTGQVRGTVTDSQGPIPGVTVTAVNTASGARSSAAVAVNGTYVLVFRPGGTRSASPPAPTSPGRERFRSASARA